MGEDLNKPLSKEDLERLQKKLKGKGGSPGQVWKKATSGNRSKLLAHGKFFDEYGRIKKKPRGMTPSGKPFDMPVDKKQQKKNKAKHDRLYHGS
tara:strand:- start:327 stop:608 length:282 start_codon:yes stop_codon:yes gene_type:complete